MFVVGDNLGALNLYGDHVGAFDEESLLIGGVLAQHASVTMMGAAAEAHFDKALAGRDLSGQTWAGHPQPADLHWLDAVEQEFTLYG